MMADDKRTNNISALPKTSVWSVHDDDCGGDDDDDVDDRDASDEKNYDYDDSLSFKEQAMAAERENALGKMCMTTEPIRPAPQIDLHFRAAAAARAGIINCL